MLPALCYSLGSMIQDVQEADIGSLIRIASMDSGIQALLEGVHTVECGNYSRHFTQNEDFFIELDRPYQVERMPIHHDVRESRMGVVYRDALFKTLSNLVPLVPGLFLELRYFFDPSQILFPCFFRLYSVHGRFYLFLLRLDLVCRPLESEILVPGSNDMTASYRTRRLYLSADIIPLDSIIKDGERTRGFRPLELVADTWIGETGKGYLLRGIWMDSELSKFFTKLFTPAGKRLYPWYPFSCKYRSMCLSIVDISPESRRNLVPYLHHALDMIRPNMDEISEVLKMEAFGEELEIFRRLKQEVPKELYRPWTEILISPYLNANDQKEFRVELSH